MSLSEQEEAAVLSQEKNVLTAANEQTGILQEGANTTDEAIDLDHIREDIRQHISKPTVS